MTKPLEEFGTAAKNRRRRYIDPNGCQACDTAAGCRTGVKIRLTATGQCLGCKAASRWSVPGPAALKVGARHLPPDTIIGREEARARGWTVYRTGLPCSRGHYGFRYVAACACVDCGRKDGTLLDAGSLAVMREAPDTLLPAPIARAYGLAVYRDGEACQGCGASSWRLVAGGDCVTCRGVV